MVRADVRTKTRVGVILFASLVLLAGALLFIGGTKGFFIRRTSYFAHFPNSQGLLTGNQVRLAGVVVGAVRDIEVPRSPGPGPHRPLRHRAEVPASRQDGQPRRDQDDRAPRRQVPRGDARLARQARPRAGPRDHRVPRRRARQDPRGVGGPRRQRRRDLEVPQDHPRPDGEGRGVPRRDHLDVQGRRRALEVPPADSRIAERPHDRHPAGARPPGPPHSRRKVRRRHPRRAERRVGVPEPHPRDRGAGHEDRRGPRPGAALGPGGQEEVLRDGRFPQGDRGRARRPSRRTSPGAAGSSRSS